MHNSLSSLRNDNEEKKKEKEEESNLKSHTRLISRRSALLGKQSQLEQGAILFAFVSVSRFESCSSSARLTEARRLAQAQANGSLELRDCNVTQLDDTTFELTSSVGSNYTLQAALRSEVEQWIEAVLYVLSMHGQSSEDALG